MPGDIAVCIKQVPHPDCLAKLSLDAARGTVNREGVPAVINPVDRNAVEASLRLREKLRNRVIALTMGPPAARKALEDALAMGADYAVHLCDRAFAGADTLATARALAGGIRSTGGIALIICGNTTIDSGTGQVAAQLAEMLDFPCVTDIEEIMPEDGASLLVKRAWEQGDIRVRVRLPAVLAVNAKINQPRLPNVLDIMAARQKEIKEWCAADAKVEAGCVGLAGSPTQFWQAGEFHARRQGEILRGSPDEMVAAAVDKLKKLELI
ncbi:MAG: electron transfer flavoprotein subunit beta/FixA family protein [Dehalococcoidales bacterium]|nr:electron transfer flavoprotein subunit beta/FixA family protein [Dehalococcoidales bacterium]